MLETSQGSISFTKSTELLKTKTQPPMAGVFLSQFFIRTEPWQDNYAKKIVES